MKKIISIFLIILFLIFSGCAEKPLAVLTTDPIEIDMAEEFDPYSVFSDIQDGADITYELDEENNRISFVVSKGDKQELYEGIDVKLIYPDSIITPAKVIAKTNIEIYSKPSTESFLKGYTREGDAFEIFEMMKDKDDVWYRISNNYWIKDSDPSSLTVIPYDTDITFIHDETSYVEIPDTIIGNYYELYIDGIPADDEYAGHYIVKDKDKYDENGRLISQTLDMGDWIEIYNYKYDSRGNRIYKSIENIFAGTSRITEYSFTYDERNMILTESVLDGSTGKPKNTIYHVYDDNGNIIRVEKSYNDRDQSWSFEYNGNLRFEYRSKEYDDDPYTKDTIVFRYDNTNKVIESFLACHGDIRNKNVGYK